MRPCPARDGGGQAGQPALALPAGKLVPVEEVAVGVAEAEDEAAAKVKLSLSVLPKYLSTLEA